MLFSDRGEAGTRAPGNFYVKTAREQGGTAQPGTAQPSPAQPIPAQPIAVRPSPVWPIPSRLSPSHPGRAHPIPARPGPAEARPEAAPALGRCCRSAGGARRCPCLGWSRPGSRSRAAWARRGTPTRIVPIFYLVLWKVRAAQRPFVGDCAVSSVCGMFCLSLVRSCKTCSETQIVST